MPKDLTDILDVQRYSSMPTVKIKDLPEIKYIAGDLFHMGEFKKWTLGMPIVAYSSGVGDMADVNGSRIKNKEKNKEKILYTVVSGTKIPIRLENMDSHKILAKRSGAFLTVIM